MFRTLASVMGLLFMTALLAGCFAISGDEPVDPVPSSSSVVVKTPGTPSGLHENLPSARASAETIAPDFDVVADMRCEPLSTETSAYVPAEQRTRLAPVAPIQVLIGDGLVNGEQWWVVAFERSGSLRSTANGL